MRTSPIGRTRTRSQPTWARSSTKQAFDGTGLIYGMGHAVYTLSDPRAEVCRRYARTLAAKKDLGEEFALIERIERLAPQVMRDHGMTKPICANIDLYTGFIYKMLGVPETLFTPLFAVARMAGWSAHRMESSSARTALFAPRIARLSSRWSTSRSPIARTRTVIEPERGQGIIALGHAFYASRKGCIK